MRGWEDAAYLEVFLVQRPDTVKLTQLQGAVGVEPVGRKR